MTKINISLSILVSLNLLQNIKLTSAVIGGTKLDVLTKHSTVMIELQFDDGRTNVCSGTILSERYVLTAAHCFVTIPMETKPAYEIPRIQQIEVIIGAKHFREHDDSLLYDYRFNIKGPNFQWSRLVKQKYIPGKNYSLQKISINSTEVGGNVFGKNIIIHEDWFAKLNNNLKTFEYSKSSDIALIHLPKPINFSKTNSEPAIIYGGFSRNSRFQGTKTKTDKNSKDHFNRRIATVAGFGRSSQKFGNDLYPIFVPDFMVGKFTIDSHKISKNKSAEQKSVPYLDTFTAKGDIIENVWGNRRVQVCKGDSGGPIFVKMMVETEMKNVQIGMTVASGNGKCTDGYSEFLSIKDHVSWIEEKMFVYFHQPFIFRD